MVATQSVLSTWEAFCFSFGSPYSLPVLQLFSALEWPQPLLYLNAVSNATISENLPKHQPFSPDRNEFLLVTAAPLVLRSYITRSIYYTGWFYN